jgi:hypothetical protein
MVMVTDRPTEMSIFRLDAGQFASKSVMQAAVQILSTKCFTSPDKHREHDHGLTF